MNKKYNVLIIIGFFFCGIGSVAAQDIPVTHFMHLNPFQFYTDVTADLPYNGYVTFPGIGNVNVGVYNNALRYNKIFERDEAGYPIGIKANEFVNSLATFNNAITADVNEEIFGFGFRIKKKCFMSIDYRVRANAEVSFSKDLPGFLVLGNMAYLGDENEADMRIGLQGTAYQELGVGFQQKVNDHWTWGIRPKLLFGALNVQTQSLQARVHTNPDDYALTLNYEAQARLASCMPITMNLNNGSYDFELGEFSRDVIGDAFRNLGAAIDLGLRYNPTSKIGVSLSVTDLGFIHWKTNTYQIESCPTNEEEHFDNGDFHFAGLTNDDIELLLSDGGTETMLDSLADYFPLFSSPTGAYNTMLHSRLQAQFDYKINKSNRLSVLAQGRIYNRSLHPALTVAYNGSFFKIIDVCVAYTLQQKSYDNLAVGLGLNLGPINLYVTTHNILPAFDQTYLSKVTASVGLVVNWGHLRNNEQ